MENNNSNQKKIYHFDKSQIEYINTYVEDNIEVLLEYFNIEYKHSGKILQMCCPIHLGDNPSACNIYVNKRNDYDNVHWACRTHLCHKKYPNNMIGFVRGVLTSHNELKIDTTSFNDTLLFLIKFYNIDINSICKSDSKDQDKVLFNRMVHAIEEKSQEQKTGLSRKEIRSRLQIPSAYFFGRKFDPKILDDYDVGDCYKVGAKMSYRAVVPIYDLDSKYVGATGRSLNPKCKECGFYHSPNSKEHFPVPKWKNTPDLNRDNILFNLNKAMEHICRLNFVIIVESPGNLLRLIEFGHYNSVATLGTEITEKQKELINMTGALGIIYIADNDEAGKNASEKVKEMFSKTHKLYFPKINKDDVAEMDVEDYKIFLEPIIKEVENSYK